MREEKEMMGKGEGRKEGNCEEKKKKRRRNGKEKSGKG